MTGIRFSVKSDLKRVFNSLNRQRRRVVPRAANRTLNEVGALARTQLRRDVRRRTGLSAKDVNPQITLKRSSFRTLTAYVRSTGQAYNLFRQKARQLKSGGVSVATGRGRQRRKDAFIIGRAVGVRRGSQIKWLYGAPTDTGFVQPEAQQLVTNITAQFGRRFARNIRYYSRGRSFG